MKLFDLHCDTAFEIFKKKSFLFENEHDISFSRAGTAFSSYAQVMAIWTDRKKDNETCYRDFLSMREYLLSQAEKCESVLCLTGNDVKAAWKAGKTAFFLGVEGARILDGKKERIDEIYKLGVRFLTLMWAGKDVIGSSHDICGGLTAFGIYIVERCMELGIAVDVSHASRAVTRQCIDMSKRCGVPIIATHSNSFSVSPHTRNLKDEEAKDIASVGGVIGISLAPEHLSPSGKADISDIIRHAEHYFSLGLSENICLGCDFDGISSKPAGINGITDLAYLADAFVKNGFSSEDTEKIFYKNALSFSERIFGGQCPQPVKRP
ncbi:MAG: dipeptidase [Eubacteriales bacterium]